MSQHDTPPTATGFPIVSYSANADGYEVTVIDGGNILDHYSAGNSPNDSYQYETDPRYAVRERTLWKYARQTALDMAREYGVPRYRVQRVG